MNTSDMNDFVSSGSSGDAPSKRTRKTTADRKPSTRKSAAHGKAPAELRATTARKGAAERKESSPRNGATSRKRASAQTTPATADLPHPVSASAAVDASIRTPNVPGLNPTRSVAPCHSPGPSRSIDSIDRLAMIATAAYYRAERRHFARGHELEDWLKAEAEIDLLLRAQLQGTSRRTGSA